MCEFDKYDTAAQIQSKKLGKASSFSEKCIARLECLTAYAVGQLCLAKMNFSINDPTAYVICSIYSMSVFPDFVMLTSQLLTSISKKVHITFILFLGE